MTATRSSSSAYETTLRTKLAQDPQSAAMMDIIVNNVYMDPGVFYSRQLEDFYKYPRTVIQSKKNNIVSHYAGLNKKTNRLLQQLITKLDKIATGSTN
jgi:hypothetical protein